MNTYIVPVKENGKLYIKKIAAAGEHAIKDKLYNYFFNKYTFLEGDSLEEIQAQLYKEAGVEFGQIYDAEEFI